MKDTTGDYGDEFMHAALVTNLPVYVGAIVTTEGAVDLLLGATMKPTPEIADRLATLSIRAVTAPNL